MKRIFAFILLFLMLAGCGQQEKTDSLAAEDVSKAPVSEEQLLESASVRPEKSEMRITVQSKTEIRPVEPYVGQGYSIYITEDSWHLDRELEDGGILEDIWESALHGDDAELKVGIYPNVTAVAAKPWNTEPPGPPPKVTLVIPSALSARTVSLIALELVNH